MELSEAERDDLLRRAQHGDADAAEALVELLHPTVAAVVRRCVPSREDTVDLVQEVFIKMFRHLDQLEGGGRGVFAWARRIALTTCLNRQRWWQSRPELRWTDLPPEQLELLEQSPDLSATSTVDSQIAARDLVARLLEHLEPRDRLLIELLELEQCDPEEVQRLTGWSAVNVRVRAFRARRKLRQALAKLISTNEP